MFSARGQASPVPPRIDPARGDRALDRERGLLEPERNGPFPRDVRGPHAAAALKRGGLRQCEPA